MPHFNQGSCARLPFTNVGAKRPAAAALGITLLETVVSLGLMGVVVLPLLLTSSAYVSTKLVKMRQYVTTQNNLNSFTFNLMEAMAQAKKISRDSDATQLKVMTANGFSGKVEPTLFKLLPLNGADPASRLYLSKALFRKGVWVNSSPFPTLPAKYFTVPSTASFVYCKTRTDCGATAAYVKEAQFVKFDQFTFQANGDGLEKNNKTYTLATDDPALSGGNDGLGVMALGSNPDIGLGMEVPNDVNTFVKADDRSSFFGTTDVNLNSFAFDLANALAWALPLSNTAAGIDSYATAYSFVPEDARMPLASRSTTALGSGGQVVDLNRVVPEPRFGGMYILSSRNTLMGTWAGSQPYQLIEDLWYWNPKLNEKLRLVAASVSGQSLSVDEATGKAYFAASEDATNLLNHKASPTTDPDVYTSYQDAFGLTLSGSSTPNGMRYSTLAGGVGQITNLYTFDPNEDPFVATNTTFVRSTPFSMGDAYTPGTNTPPSAFNGTVSTAFADGVETTVVPHGNGSGYVWVIADDVAPASEQPLEMDFASTTDKTTFMAAGKGYRHVQRVGFFKEGYQANNNWVYTSERDRLYGATAPTGDETTLTNLVRQYHFSGSWAMDVPTGTLYTSCTTLPHDDPATTSVTEQLVEEHVCGYRPNSAKTAVNLYVSETGISLGDIRDNLDPANGHASHRTGGRLVIKDGAVVLNVNKGPNAGLYATKVMYNIGSVVSPSYVEEREFAITYESNPAAAPAITSAKLNALTSLGLVAPPPPIQVTQPAEKGQQPYNYTFGFLGSQFYTIAHLPTTVTSVTNTTVVVPGTTTVVNPGAPTTIVTTVRVNNGDGTYTTTTTTEYVDQLYTVADVKTAPTTRVRREETGITYAMWPMADGSALYFGEQDSSAIKRYTPASGGSVTTYATLGAGLECAGCDRTLRVSPDGRFAFAEAYTTSTVADPTSYTFARYGTTNDFALDHAATNPSASYPAAYAVRHTLPGTRTQFIVDTVSGQSFTRALPANVNATGVAMDEANGFFFFNNPFATTATDSALSSFNYKAVPTTRSTAFTEGDLVKLPFGLDSEWGADQKSAGVLSFLNQNSADPAAPRLGWVVTGPSRSFGTFSARRYFKTETLSTTFRMAYSQGGAKVGAWNLATSGVPLLSDKTVQAVAKDDTASTFVLSKVTTPTPAVTLGRLNCLWAGGSGGTCDATVAQDERLLAVTSASSPWFDMALAEDTNALFVMERQASSTKIHTYNNRLYSTTVAPNPTASTPCFNTTTPCAPDATVTLARKYSGMAFNSASQKLYLLRPVGTFTPTDASFSPTGTLEAASSVAIDVYALGATTPTTTLILNGAVGQGTANTTERNLMAALKSAMDVDDSTVRLRLNPQSQMAYITWGTGDDVIQWSLADMP
jgi:hypothetical protein